MYAWDKDDHLLRARVSEGSAFGVALHARGALDWRPRWFGWSWLSLDAWGELRYFYAEGGVDQHWYAGGSEGNSYSDLPYKLESFQPQIGVGFAVQR